MTELLMITCADARVTVTGNRPDAALDLSATSTETGR
jgi:hypothetical protein